MGVGKQPEPPGTKPGYDAVDAPRSPDGSAQAHRPRDVVACYSEDLGEWSAAQITDLNPECHFESSFAGVTA